jgi:hypothetical protein
MGPIRTIDEFSELPEKDMRPNITVKRRMKTAMMVFFPQQASFQLYLSLLSLAKFSWRLL